MKKPWFRALLALVLLCGILTACGNSAAVKDTISDADGTDTEAPLRIVATIFPVYDWLRQILGENAGNVDLTLLLGNGVDLHSYQPSVEDMVKISSCDLFVYVGGESDEWVKDALSTAVNPDMAAINLLETLGDAVKEEEVVEGMQAEEEDEDDGNPAEQSDSDDTGEAEAEYDEHVWLSLRNAQALCDALTEALCALDPDDAPEFTRNLDAYKARLRDLDAQYETAVRDAPVKTLLFGDRFPFRYLVDDYGLQYYAAFAGCSAETEASFETVIFLANKADELRLSAVLTLENSDGKIARTIVENTAAKSARILGMDSMQSVTARDAENGVTYLRLMEGNLETLREALR